MASEWPAWVWHYYDEARAVRGQWPWIEDDDCEEMEPYIHRDAARAWQAFRDFLNGTPEQWARLLYRQWANGYAFAKKETPR